MTDLTRRTVLATGATGAAVAVVGLPTPGLAVAAPQAAAAPAVAAAPRAYTRNAKLYRRKRFKKQRKARFKVVGPGVRLKMKLVDVSNIPLVTRGSNRSFELTFTTRRPGPGQGTYTVKRRKFKATSLFLVPTDASHRRYRATINNR
ncbi:DUF6916 family protein [Nocardioides humi]|uniref:DUF6916 domain-containing protein n=1 Tax=Nocardioides humi TaxID=449461 RepID=A0ABN2BQ60_9ACTN|nr:hypothetical protein [Nocardioides humi]